MRTQNGIFQNRKKNVKYVHFEDEEILDNLLKIRNKMYNMPCYYTFVLNGLEQYTFLTGLVAKKKKKHI